MKVEDLQAIMYTTKEQVNTLSKQSFLYSMIRFGCIIGVIFCIYFGYYKIAFLYTVAAVIFLLFLYVVRLHVFLKQKIEDLNAYMEVHEDILLRKGKEWKNFQDEGTSYLNEELTQAYDLDIFGKASLYQYLCVAKTPFGKDALASMLTPYRQESGDISKRQEAVCECITNTTFTLEMTSLLKLYEAHGMKKKKSAIEDFFLYMEDEEKTYPKQLQYLCIFVSFCTLTAAFLTIFFSVSYAYVLVFATFSLVVSFLSFFYNSAKLASLGDRAEMMKDYERMFAAIQKETFTSTYMKDIQMRVKHANQGIQSLQRILHFIKLRSNSVMSILLNAFFLFDFQCVISLAHVKQTYGKQIRVWLHSLGDMEAILSLAQLGFVKDEWIIPVLKQGAPYLEINDMKHPLLVEEEAISNSFRTNHGSLILTGSNMSGKTTFLRTIGVNMILFHAGAPVCASHFQASSMNVFTSMRVHDDVSEGISTFYAEILRIKQMMQASDTKVPMLVFIDEIFKGTNSADRILCAKQAIVRLHLPWVITMVSTHDFELCDLEDDKDIQAVNYHFSEYYEEDNICFDYTLKDGRCTTTNARQLMKLAGF